MTATAAPNETAPVSDLSRIIAEHLHREGPLLPILHAVLGAGRVISRHRPMRRSPRR